MSKAKLKLRKKMKGFRKFFVPHQGKFTKVIESAGLTHRPSLPNPPKSFEVLYALVNGNASLKGDGL